MQPWETLIVYSSVPAAFENTQSEPPLCKTSQLTAVCTVCSHTPNTKNQMKLLCIADRSGPIVFCDFQRLKYLDILRLKPVLKDSAPFKGPMDRFTEWLRRLLIRHTHSWLFNVVISSSSICFSSWTTCRTNSVDINLEVLNRSDTNSGSMHGHLWTVTSQAFFWPWHCITNLNGEKKKVATEPKKEV